MSKNAMSIQELEAKAIEMMQTNSKRSQGINNKTILFELLTNGSYPRLVAPVKAATLYFAKIKKNPTTDEYSKKIVSIKNSLDTMVSDYNFKEKIESNYLTAGTVLVEENGMLSIQK